VKVEAVWHIVKESAKSIGVAKLAPHDLRTDLCTAVATPLEVIGADPILLGHVRCKRMERYLAASSGFDQPS